MCRGGVIAEFFVTWFFIAAMAHAQTGFSADVVELKRSASPAAAKIYFAQERMRFEPQNVIPRNAPPIVYMVYLKTQTSFAILPQQRVYAEIPIREDWSMYTSFLSGDVENACGNWDKFSHGHGGDCRKVGTEIVNGRPTVKYEGRCSRNESCQVWVDRALRFLVKWEDGSNSRELRNIQEGEQLPTLFEIPAGFTKVQATAGTVQSSKPH